MTETFNDKLYEGDVRTWIVTVTDQDGDVVVLTTAEWVLMDANGQTAMTKAEGDGIQLTDPQNGQLQINIGKTDTTDNGGYYTHYLQVEDDNGNTNVVLTGNLTIKESPF